MIDKLCEYSKGKVTLDGDLAPLSQIKEQLRILLISFAGEYPDIVVTDDDISDATIKIYDELTSPPEPPKKQPRARGIGDSMLQVARMAKGLSAAGLSRNSGVSVHTIQDYEKYYGKINRGYAEIVIKLADALGVHPYEILDEIEGA